MATLGAPVIEYVVGGKPRKFPSPVPRLVVLIK